MSKGFLIFADNTNKVNYLEQAYVLALSIKNTQTVNNVTVVTNEEVPDKYKQVFDNVILPFKRNNNLETPFKVEDRANLYHITPYEETMVLDSDMLFLEDIENWWNYCSNYNLRFCSRITNYKKEIVTDTVHRKTFVENNLPSPYVALHYYKRSDEALEFHKVLNFVVNNWELCLTKFAPKQYQSWISMDLAVAVTLELMVDSERIIDKNNPLEFVHMKTHLQGWDNVPEKWQNTVPYVFNNNGDLYVSNIKQGKVFHYIEKDFVKSNMVKKLENLVYGS